ncbi:MAG: peptidoglycan DD-metalloendopeptidase family protein [Leptospirales bacterium]|nr:peptidoglycan DD-metalloendopeptidase family protein [Leptospirales bacterium]
MFTRKDVRTTLKVSFFTVLFGVLFGLCPVSASTKTKGKTSTVAPAPKSVKTQNKQNVAAKNTATLQHKVNSGENLYRISIKYNVSLDELMRVNNLKDNNIRAGMTLKIPVGSGKPALGNADKKIFFDWPVKKVTFYKEDGFDGVKSIGIIISAPTGSSVHSSAQGVVEKVGFMRGYGNFVLVKHPDNYFTIYSYLENVRVKKGQAVGKGMLIGYVDHDKKSMHFQIDRNGKPVNPLDHLPKKNR